MLLMAPDRPVFSKIGVDIQNVEFDGFGECEAEGIG